MSVDTFFEESQRDGQGRPLIRNGPVAVPYTRASSLADYISDNEHIHRWEMRYLAKAMGKHEDLAALAASERYNTGLSDVLEQRDKTASGRRLDTIIERALDRERIHEKADYGTAIHAFTEPGYDPTSVPERMREDVASFWSMIAREACVIERTEQFTVNHATGSAGTFDHLCRFIGHPILKDYVVCDKKTGNITPHEWAIQIASYAYGEPYDLPEQKALRWPGKINLEYGVVFHIKGGKTTLYVLDLQTGYQAAQIAAQARDYQELTLISGYKPATFSQRLDAASTRDDLAAVWHSADGPVDKGLVELKASTLQ